MATTTTKDGYFVTVLETDSRLGGYVAFVRGLNWGADDLTVQAHGTTALGATRKALKRARNITTNGYRPI
jgi:hypothetical protein